MTCWLLAGMGWGIALAALYATWQAHGELEETRRQAVEWLGRARDAEEALGGTLDGLEGEAEEWSLPESRLSIRTDDEDDEEVEA